MLRVRGLGTWDYGLWGLGVYVFRGSGGQGVRVQEFRVVGI